MTIKEKLRNLVEKINKHKVTSIVALGLAGLVIVTSLKDNVHLGAVGLHNPQENHYAWGIWPTIGIKGEKDENIRGNFYSIGLVGRNYADPNSTITGNMNSWSLLAGINNIGENSTITGNMEAYGLIIGENDVGNNSTITGNMNSWSLLAGINDIGENSTITGNMKAYGLIIGSNEVGNNSTITGDIVSKGLLVSTPMKTNFGSSVEFNLKNYVVKKEEENKK